MHGERDADEIDVVEGVGLRGFDGEVEAANRVAASA
jgi:hypothetical protein